MVASPHAAATPAMVLTSQPQESGYLLKIFCMNRISFFFFLQNKNFSRYIKLFYRNLNIGPYSSHSTNIYIYGVSCQKWKVVKDKLDCVEWPNLLNCDGFRNFS